MNCSFLKKNKKKSAEEWGDTVPLCTKISNIQEVHWFGK